MRRQSVRQLMIAILWLGGPVQACLAVLPNLPPVVVPNAATNVEGADNNGFPFWPVGANPPSMRYQQVYASSEFSAVPPAGGLVTQIAFRADSLSPAFSFTVSSVQINLSTTTLAPDGLSTTFATNVGTDDTIVFGPGPLSISSALGPSSGPNPFNIVIPLATPFLYRPGLGNLLVDFRTIGGNTDISLDAINQVGDSISRQYSSTVNGNLNSPTASTLVPSYGLVTQFTMVAIPEPATVALGAMGVGVLVGRVKSRGSRVKRRRRSPWPGL